MPEDRNRPSGSTAGSIRKAADRLIRRLRAAGAARGPVGGGRSQQELAETAMAMLTLWATFDEAETDHVAATTRTLVSDLSAEEMGYLVLHLAGVSRGVLHVMAGPDRPELSEALHAVARGVATRTDRS